MDLLLKLLIVFLIILLNAYFVASEFALITIRKTRVNEMAKKGNSSAKYIQEAQKNLPIIISATQLGVTIASLTIGWIGESTVAGIIQKFLIFLPDRILIITSNAIAIIIAFVIITFLQIVIGELVPKTIALQKTEKTALTIILPLIIFAKIFAPFIWVLNKTGNIIVHLLGFSTSNEQQTYHSEDEIKMLLRQSGKQGIIPNREIEIVQNVFELNDLTVKTVMIPRTEILAFDLSIKIASVIKKIEQNKHSRFPVYEKSLDSIVGFIHIKDIYRVYLRQAGKKSIAEAKIVRRVIIVPEIKKIDSVLQEMRAKRVHMAVVTDEYGGTEGIVTLEDIFESLVGEINDEFDNPIETIKKNVNGRYRVEGATLITDIEKMFSVSIPQQGYSTIGGLLFGLLGHEPHKHDKIQIRNLEFTIMQTEGKRIKTLQVKEIKENNGK